MWYIFLTSFFEQFHKFSKSQSRRPSLIPSIAITGFDNNSFLATYTKVAWGWKSMAFRLPGNHWKKPAKPHKIHQRALLGLTMLGSLLTPGIHFLICISGNLHEVFITDCLSSTERSHHKCPVDMNREYTSEDILEAVNASKCPHRGLLNLWTYSRNKCRTSFEVVFQGLLPE